MRHLPRLLLLTFSGTLAYHLVTALVSLAMGLSWRQAAFWEPGLAIIMLASGAAAQRVTGRVWLGPLVGMAAGLAHGTLGWQITAEITGTGLPGGADHVNARQEFLESWLHLSAVLGGAGSAAAWMLRGRREAEPM